jgi:hypothetical protein
VILFGDVWLLGMLEKIFKWYLKAVELSPATDCLVIRVSSTAGPLARDAVTLLVTTGILAGAGAG